ncbi:MAG: hypothetical protein V1808_01425 [Candidatus Daviesbacteria bacterium]
MQQSVKYYWKGKDIKVRNLSEKEILYILLKNKLLPFLTFLTQYYPFSLLWQDRRFHYKFMEFSKADDFIIKIASKKNYWFKLLACEKNSNFINTTGMFISSKKGNDCKDMVSYFRESVADRDIFINELEDAKVNIKIAINNIPNLK